MDTHPRKSFTSFLAQNFSSTASGTARLRDHTTFCPVPNSISGGPLVLLWFNEAGLDVNLDLQLSLTFHASMSQKMIGNSNSIGNSRILSSSGASLGGSRVLKGGCATSESHFLFFFPGVLANHP